MIKIGTYLVKDAVLPVSERLRITVDAGFDFLCLTTGALFSGDLTPAMCLSAGVDFDNVHLTGKETTCIWSEGEHGQQVTERYCDEIRRVSEFGIKTGIIHVTWGAKTIPAPISELGLSRFETIIRAAEKYGVDLAFENSVFPEYLHAVLGRFDSPRARYCFDSGHRNAFCPNENFVERYGDRLAATHMQDNEGASDLHMMPFDGSIDWNSIAHMLAGTALGRDHICAEVAGIVSRECPGQSAGDIRRSLANIAILNDEQLVDIHDGGFSIYDKLTYEQRVQRLAAAMRRLADMVEKA
ncbi:MAG: sugar phosphate isomerase/epimerase [Eubacteriales bacterium]|nr:sugar phosphate isomerase/epimerase [Eubacteriales bacterium]